MIKYGYTIAGCLSLCWLIGCGGGVSVPEDWPEWSQQLPAQGLDAKVGDQVWAAIPRMGDVGSLTGVFRVESIKGKSAVLADSLGNRFEDVPGALIHHLPERELKTGDLVLVDVAAQGPVWGRLTDPDSVSYDWNGVTVSGVAAQAVPFSSDGESRSLQRLIYQHNERQHLGLGIAEDSENVWVLEADGRVRVLAKSEVSAVSGSDTDWQPGKKVLADSWASGLTTGEIVAVVEPGLRFQVNLAGSAEPRTLPFSSLTVAAEKAR